MAYTSLVDIYTSRPDLQAAFPNAMQPGAAQDSLNKWWNTNGVHEYPNVTLVAPGDSRIQAPSTLTVQAQAGQAPLASPYQSAGQAPGTAPQLATKGGTTGSAIDLGHGVSVPVGSAVRVGYNGQVYINDGGTLKLVSGDASGLPITNIAPEFAPGVQGMAQGTYTGKSATTSTGDPKYDALLTSLDGYLRQLQAKGQVINPNVTLTPEQISDFTAKAQAQIDPYYASQLKLARETLLRDQGYNSDEILQNEQDIERKYGVSARGIASNAADQGFALSGGRARDEQTLATDTQNTIDSGRRQLNFNAGNQAINFAGKFGGSDIPNSSLSSAPQVVPGQLSFNRSGTSSPYYSLSPSLTSALQNTVGSEQNSETSAIGDLSSKLQSNATSQLANNQLRTLTL